MVFQQPNPFPMSIFDNVAFALREQSRRRPAPPRARAAGRSTRSQRAGLWDEVARQARPPALRLSGGQQQRLCIARAIASEPEILLMDEPCSALDPRSTATIEELIRHLREELAIVIVTHNLQQARRVADRVAFMYLGDLVELGSAEQIFARATRAPHARVHRRRLRMRRRRGARGRSARSWRSRGCETTQELSAKIGRELGHQSAIAGTTSIGSREPRGARRCAAHCSCRKPGGGRARADEHRARARSRRSRC